MAPINSNPSEENSPLLKEFAPKYASDEEAGGGDTGSLTCDWSTHSHSFSVSSSESHFLVPMQDVEETKLQRVWDRIDKGALQFALRMAVVLSISALFVVVDTDRFHFPNGIWVLISVLFVCWFPALDAASVIEKVVQRLIGTFVGSFIGLSCGFASIYLFHSPNAQTIFLEVCMFAGNFAIIFAAGQAKVDSQKVISKFSYATILCVLTFCICMLPFANSVNGDRKWESAVWRIINVIVGCLLGAMGAIFVCPKSTADVLHERAAKQVKMAGDAAEALLHTAADFFAGRIEVTRLEDDILETQLESSMNWKFLLSNSLPNNSREDSIARADIALKKYEEAIGDWKMSKMLFPLAQYDPFTFAARKTDSNRNRQNVCPFTSNPNNNCGDGWHGPKRRTLQLPCGPLSHVCSGGCTNQANVDHSSSGGAERPCRKAAVPIFGADTKVHPSNDACSFTWWGQV